jgi:hypothetical protein
MSLVHRVVILNKPLKIRGFTVQQWIVMALAAAVSFAVGSFMPGNIKIANLPIGFIIGMIIFCGALFISQALQMKPLTWWRNMISYRLKLAPQTYLPHSEPGTIYPDPTVIDKERKEDRPFVSQEDRPYKYSMNPFERDENDR